MANVLSRQPSLIPPDFGICVKSTISLAETALQLLKTHTVLAEEALYQASYGVSVSLRGFECGYYYSRLIPNRLWRSEYARR